MKEYIHRIPSHYVDKDKGCAQIMLPYQQTLTLFNKDGIQFNQNENQYEFINEYLTNMKRYSFPYHNIPNHIRRQGWFGRTNITNQLLNFEEHYISITDGKAIDRCILFDKDDALMMTKIFPNVTSDESEFSNIKKRMNREELDNMFKPSNENEKVYIATSTGDIYHSDGMGYQVEKYFVEQQKKKFTEQFESGKDHFSKDAIVFFETKIKEMDITDLKDYPLPPSFYLIKMNGTDISIELIYTTLITTNDYEVIIKKLPLNKYVLEQFKYMAPNIIELKEPRISLRLNQGITKEDISNAKEMVLSMRNQ